MKRFLKAAVAATVLAAGSASALAANVSFTGHLAAANDVQLFNFTLNATSNVTLRTWSYAGGVNAAGSAIGAGGFDPIVSLFFGSGSTALLIGASDDGFGVATDSSTGSALDSLLDSFGLGAGTYTVALTQSANFANGPTLADGFLGAGNPGFDGRSSTWALDFRGVSTATAVPEPTTLVLGLLGLVAMGATRRRESVAALSA